VDAPLRLDPAAALARIRAARERIRPFVRRTPTVLSYTFTESTGSQVFLKLENLQRTGSFKVRGALNRILCLAGGPKGRNLVAASAGNHAQGVALAAKLTGAHATLVMPSGTPLLKIRRTEGYGARVVLHGRNWDEAQAYAIELSRAGALLIHPFDDPEVIEGQGTVGLEILEELPEVDLLLVPVGGGGLAAGLALAVKAQAPEVRVIGVQAEGAAAMARSFARGAREIDPDPRTIADGIRVGAPGMQTFEIVRELLDDVVTVTETEITQAIVEMLEKSKVVGEAAGVVGVAALIAGKIHAPAGSQVCAVLSGGNIDLNLLARLIESGLASSGFLHLVRLRIADTPGQLQRVLEVLSARGCNVLDVQHYRAGWKVPIGRVDVEILLETRAPEQGAEIERSLAASGLAPEP